jgi:NAD(P)H-nitrite reductase large subunit
MNSIGDVKNNYFHFKQNGSEIKEIKKTEPNNSFKDHMKRAKKICSCFSITEADIDQFKNLNQLIKETHASTRCNACLNDLKKHFNS